jgi:hypothetical protein
MGVTRDGRPAGLRRARRDPRLIPSYAYPCDGCGRWRQPGGYGECVSCGRQPMLDKMPTRHAYVPCVECGKPSSAGRCQACTNVGRRYWTRLRIIQALLAQHEQTGRVPMARDWRKSTPDHPTFQWTARLFGSWNEALQAAGLRPRPTGFQAGWSHVPPPNPQREVPGITAVAGDSPQTAHTAPTDHPHADKKPLQTAGSTARHERREPSGEDGTVAA